MAQQQPQAKARIKPVHEIRMGRIRAAIWVNETQNGIRHNVTVTRLYKDGDNWKDSTSFGRDDLPLVGKVLDRCHSWIFAELMAASSSNGATREHQPVPDVEYDDSPF